MGTTNCNNSERHSVNQLEKAHLFCVVRIGKIICLFSGIAKVSRSPYALYYVYVKKKKESITTRIKKILRVSSVVLISAHWLHLYSTSPWPCPASPSVSAPTATILPSIVVGMPRPIVVATPFAVAVTRAARCALRGGGSGLATPRVGRGCAVASARLAVVLKEEDRSVQMRVTGKGWCSGFVLTLQATFQHAKQPS